MAQLLVDAWNGSPEDRPTFSEIFDRMLKENFMIVDGVNPAEVFKVLEWAAGRP
jgi:hypothetical protein